MADAVAVSFKGREAIGRGFESRYDQILTFCEKNENSRLDCVEPFSRVAAVVVKPVVVIKPVESGEAGREGESAARVLLPRFFPENSIFRFAGFERTKMVNDRLANGRFGGT